jgi:hypothetical protein
MYMSGSTIMYQFIVHFGYPGYSKVYLNDRALGSYDGTTYQKQDFLDFYRAVSQYEVTETEHGFQIQEKKEGADPIDYAFYEINGRRYFSMTVL